MPVMALFNREGERVGDINLDDAVFAVPINFTVMHEVVVNYLANQRHGTQNTKTRAEVRGGGRKPWRQKGTGRARQGSIRSPQWKGGGVALGPKPRDYSYVVNKKVKRLAIKCALSAKILDKEITLLDSFDMAEIKTKEVVTLLKKLNISSKVLIILPVYDAVVARSVSNIEGVNVTFIGMVNAYEILEHKNCLILKEAAKKLEEVYA